MKEIRVGDFAELSHVVTDSEILEYAKLSGDFNPLHVNADFAATRSRNGVVAHGMIASALLSRTIGTRLPGDGSLWLNQEIEFSGTVHAGDRLTARVEIREVFKLDSVVGVSTTVMNQRGETVLRGTGRVSYAHCLSIEIPPPKVGIVPKVLVLGASGNVGNAIVDCLLRAGHSVVATYGSNPGSLESLIDAVPGEFRSSCEVVHLDATKDATFQSVADRCASEADPTLALISCIASEPNSTRVAEWNMRSAAQAIGFEAATLAHAFSILLPNMQQASFGRVISIGSSALNSTPTQGWGMYLAAKAATLSTVRSIAREYGALGISANIIAPGLLAHGMTAGISSRHQRRISSETPTGRLVSSAEVAILAKQLINSPEGGINGQLITVDGGRSIR